MKESFLFWPKTYPKIDDMAKSGLYYTGQEDEAACIVCGVILSDWKEDDEILEKHNKLSPHCELVKLLRS
jgi:hypothetical protein